MKTIGAKLDLVEEGKVIISVELKPSMMQQHGFGHAGVTFSIGDSAAGYAALTKMGKKQEVLTSEMKIQQALNDTDPVNRYLAFRSIVDEVKGTIISNLVDNTGDGADLYSNPSSDLQFKDYLNLVAAIT